MSPFEKYTRYPVKVPMCEAQVYAVQEGIKGEERLFFIDKINEIQKTFDEMPKTYEQDGKGDDAVVYLHYFTGGSDWWITEKDMYPDQFQAFGFARINMDNDNAELGYVNLHEITRLGAELDFHWTPKTLGEVKRKTGIRGAQAILSA